jgi:hypothetical protein
MEKSITEPSFSFVFFGTCSFITGVILREKFIAFEKVLWRATRGNLFMRHTEIEEKIKDPYTVSHPSFFSLSLSLHISLFFPQNEQNNLSFRTWTKLEKKKNTNEQTAK